MTDTAPKTDMARDSSIASDTTSERDTWLSIRRGGRGKCPNCGQAKLFRAYLKPVDACARCGEDWLAVRADDGPAWATMLVVGHIIGPILVASVLNESIPIWVNLGVIPAIAVIMCLAMLPVMKGVFMGIIWAKNAPTS